MKACVLLEPGRVELGEVETPEPGPGEVVVRVRAALTCGTDVKAYRRGHPMIPMPALFGHEYAGQVEAVGQGVSGFVAGQAVMGVHSGPCGTCFFCDRHQPELCERIMETKALGSFAECIRLPADVVRQNLFEKPETVSFEQAAFLEPLSCVMHGVRAAGMDNGIRSALVLGAGPIGLLFVMLLQKAGVDVLVAGRRKNRLDMALACGAHRAIDVDATGDLRSVIRDATGGRGVDAVFECTGQPGVWEASVHLVRRGGTVVLFGGCPSGTTASFDTGRLHYDEITLKGVFHFAPRDVRAAARTIVAGELPLDRLITDRYPLAGLPAALDRLLKGDGIKFAILP